MVLTELGSRSVACTRWSLLLGWGDLNGYDGTFYVVSILPHFKTIYQLGIGAHAYKPRTPKARRSTNQWQPEIYSEHYLKTESGLVTHTCDAKYGR